MPTYLAPGVFVEEVEAGTRPIEGVGTAVAAFVGLASKGPFNEAVQCTNWSQFTSTFGDFIEGAYLHHAVYGFFQNGGGVCYIVRIGAGDGSGGVPARAELTSGAEGSASTLRVTALNAGPEGNTISVEVVNPAEGAPEETFKLVVKEQGRVVEEFPEVTTKRGKQYVVSEVNKKSKKIQLEERGTGNLERPAAGAIELAGGANEAPVSVGPGDYVGDPAQRTGFGALEAIDPITMVAVPDLMSAYQQGLIDLEGVKAVQLAMITHAEFDGRSCGDHRPTAEPERAADPGMANGEGRL